MAVIYGVLREIWVLKCVFFKSGAKIIKKTESQGEEAKK